MCRNKPRMKHSGYPVKVSKICVQELVDNLHLLKKRSQVAFA